MIRNRGFAQIPLMLSLLVLTIALPVLSRVIKQSQDTRNRATDDSACILVPSELSPAPLECSTTRGCVRMVSMPAVPEGAGSGETYCQKDCTCAEIIGGDNAFCGECKKLPVEPIETPIDTPPVIVSPTTIPTITSTPSATPTAIIVTPTLIPTPEITSTPSATPTKVECDVCSSNFGCLAVKFTGDKCVGVLHDDGTQKYNRRCACGPKVAFGGGDDSECGTCWGIGDCGKLGQKCCADDDGFKKCDKGLGCDAGSNTCITCDLPIISDSFDVKFDSMIPEVDILFAFDTTGSMGPLINMAKSQGLDLLEKLDAKLGDKAKFGVVDFRDYPVKPYGAAGDYPYKLDVALTDDKTSVMNGIKGLTLGSGADTPESYTRVMYESYSDTNIVWRKDSKKIVVFLADSIEHDPDYDGKTMKEVMSAFKDKGMSLLYINVGGDSKVTNHWVEIAKKIGNGSGSYGIASITTSSTDFVSKIMELILGVVRKIDKIELKADPEKYQSWLEYDGSVGVTIPMIGLNWKFPYKVKPADVTSGVYEFNIDFIGDKTKYSQKTQKVVIKCGGPTMTPSPTSAPIICGSLDQKCCLDYKNEKFCDDGLGCDSSSDTCKKVCPSCKAIGDYSCDSVVNGLDYTWWKQEFVDKLQHEGKWAASHDCTTVTSEDYSIWRYNYLK